MKKVRITIIIIALTLGFILSRGFVILKALQWLIYPIWGDMGLTYGNCIGLSIFIGVVFNKHDKQLEQIDFVKVISEYAAYLLVSLAMAWTAQLLIY